MSKIQVESNHYFNNTYDNMERFMSYYHQINEILNLLPKSLLEIGVGNRFLSDYIKKHYAINFKTIDIDEKLMPDKIGSLLDIPFPENDFDAVVCFEVIEHIPLADLNKAFMEINRVTKKYAVISTYDCTKYYRYLIKIPGKTKEIKFLISRPYILEKKHNFNGEHYWEIGKKGSKLKDILKIIYESKFKVINNFRPFECPNNRFFVLEKI